MSSLLGRYVNKTLRLSIPILFPDGPPCVAKLLAVEPAGVWLESEALTQAIALSPAESARVFIPFAQIAFIVEELRRTATAHANRAHPADKVTVARTGATGDEPTPPKTKRPGHRSAPHNKHRR